MRSLITILYILIPFFLFYFEQPFIALFVLILEIISLFFIPTIIKLRKENLRMLIESGNFENPFINVNKAPWYLIEEVPGIDRIHAKRMVYLRRRHGKYPSLDVFFKANQIDENLRIQIEKYFCI